MSVCLSLNTKCDYIFQLWPSHSLFGHHAITFPLPHLISVYFRTGSAPLFGLVVCSHNETSKSGTTAKAYVKNKTNKQTENQTTTTQKRNRSSSTFFLEFLGFLFLDVKLFPERCILQAQRTSTTFDYRHNRLIKKVITYYLFTYARNLSCKNDLGLLTVLFSIPLV